MARVTARCTQCGSEAFGGDNNKRKYDVDASDLQHGTGSTHGTEWLKCPTCDRETLHNRCAPSVPTGT
jgi:hypothetical protein